MIVLVSKNCICLISPTLIVACFLHLCACFTWSSVHNSTLQPLPPYHFFISSSCFCMWYCYCFFYWCCWTILDIMCVSYACISEKRQSPTGVHVSQV